MEPQKRYQFKLHKHQSFLWPHVGVANPLIRELSAQAGIQGGKTTFGALALRKQKKIWDEKIGKPANWLVGADNYKTLSQSTRPTFMKVFRNLGSYKGKEESFLFHDGSGSVFFRTSTHPDSAEGIPDCAGGWLDEAGKCKRLFKINFLGRLSRLRGQAIYTSTPYSMNWLYTEVEKPFLSGERKDILVVKWSSADNPSFPLEEFERQRKILDSKTFRRKYMGIHERMEGLVYEVTDDMKIKSFQLPHNTKYYAAVDWGFTEGHEFALSVRGITETGKRYLVDEFKAAHLDPEQQVKACMGKKSIWGIKTFYCDPSRPDMIAALNKAGASAIGFHEGRESYKQLIPSITLHNALIRSGNYMIFEDKCPHAVDEYETYHWAEYDEEKPAKEEPVKMNDHLMDCERMLSVGTMNVKVEGQPEPFVRSPRLKQDFWTPIKKSKASKSWDSY